MRLINIFKGLLVKKEKVKMVKGINLFEKAHREQTPLLFSVNECNKYMQKESVRSLLHPEKRQGKNRGSILIATYSSFQFWCPREVPAEEKQS